MLPTRNGHATPKTIAATILAAIALIAATLTSAPPARADVDGVSMTWTAMPTQYPDGAGYSGQTFSYRANLACSDIMGQGCQVNSITIPLSAQYPDSPEGATPIESWQWYITVTPSTLPYIGGPTTLSQWDPDTGSWITIPALYIQFPTPIPAGSSNVIDISTIPPSGTTPDGTTWTLTPSITINGVDNALVLPGVTSSAMAFYWPAVAKYVQSVNGVNRTQTWMDTYGVKAGDTVAFVVDPLAAWSSVPCYYYGSGQLCPLSGTLVDTLPAGVTFVSATPSGYVFDPSANTVTWPVTATITTFGWAGVNVGNGSASPPTVTLLAPANPGIYTNNATFTSYGVGQTPDQAVTVTGDAHFKVVTPEGYPVGQIFNKSTNTSQPNGFSGPLNYMGLGVATPAVTADLTTDPITTATLSVYAEYLTSALDNMDFNYQDPMPCLDAPTVLGPSMLQYKSNPQGGGLCANPAWDVATITVTLTSTSPLNATTVSLTIRFTDGTSQLVPLAFTATGTNLYTATPALDLAGRRIAQVDLDGTLPVCSATDCRSRLAVTLAGVLAGGHQLNDGDAVTNTASGRAKWSISPVWGPWGDISASWYVVGYSFTAAAYFNYTTGAPTANWAYYLGDQALAASRSAVIVIPDSAVQYLVRPAGAQMNFDGAGNAKITIGDFNYGIRIPYGVTVPVTVYAGYKDRVFQTCTSGTRTTDVTGLIGSTVGTPTTLCYATRLFSTQPTSGPPAFSVVKYVKGDTDTSFLGLPGTPHVAVDGSGQATYRLQFVNTGGSTFDTATLYDVFPAAGDTRGSTMTPTLAATPAPQSGWAYSYSTSPNPCRPEVLPANPGCVDDWATTLPGDLASVTAIRIVYDNPATPIPVGAVVSFDLVFDAPAYNADTDVAWNQVSAGVQVTGEPAGSLLPVESEKVGIGHIPTWQVAVAKAATRNNTPFTSTQQFGFTVFDITTVQQVGVFDLAGGQTSTSFKIRQGDMVQICEAPAPADSDLNGMWGTPTWSRSTTDALTTSGRCVTVTPTGDITVTATNNLTTVLWRLPAAGGDPWTPLLPGAITAAVMTAGYLWTLRRQQAKA